MLDEADIFHSVKAAFIGFFEEDYGLLHVDASERSISHKLAEHLQRQFPQFHVDCEYNRHGDGVKRLNFYDTERTCPNDTEARTVFPDIIVHERGRDRKNLLVIEIKKSTNTDNVKDLMKLKAFTDPKPLAKERFAYRIGLFLEIDPACMCVSAVKVFKDGNETESDHWDGLKELGYGK